MFRSQSFDHHQGLITVLVQIPLLACVPRHIPVCGCTVCCQCVCAHEVPFRVVSGYVHSQTPHGRVLQTHKLTDNIQPQSGI
jgi:hypothetical protein